MALLVVIVGIVIYLAFRFEWRFSVSAIIANLHDVIIILGFFAAFQWEFSLSVLAAVLAVLGYSVNESVVVFDRVRETFKKTRGMSTPEVLDHAITSTISRTIITHGSTQIMVLSMLIFGGETLYYFALALTIGICFGIYSSVLVASPLVMWLGVSREQFIAKQKKAIEGMTEEVPASEAHPTGTTEPLPESSKATGFRWPCCFLTVPDDAGEITTPACSPPAARAAGRQPGAAGRINRKHGNAQRQQEGRQTAPLGRLPPSSASLSPVSIGLTRFCLRTCT